MNDLTTTTANAVQPSSLFLDTANFDTIQRTCRALASSDLVPDIYKISAKNPEGKAIANCMIALDMANRMGANPLMVMQNMYIVYGRPGWSSTFLIATVNNCGRFEPLKFKFDTDGKTTIGGREIDNMTCYAYTTERGKDEMLKGTVISLEMARLEGWATKNGSKWQTMPQQMLTYRAAAFWVRTYAPELSMGFYTREENEDIHVVDAMAEDVTPQQPSVQKRTEPAPVDNVKKMVEEALAKVEEAKNTEPATEEEAKQAEMDKQAETFFDNI
jgi:hypothetical protein